MPKKPVYGDNAVYPATCNQLRPDVSLFVSMSTVVDAPVLIFRKSGRETVIVIETGWQWAGLTKRDPSKDVWTVPPGLDYNFRVDFDNLYDDGIPKVGITGRNQERTKVDRHGGCKISSSIRRFFPK